MPTVRAKVKGEILEWARSSAGYSVDEVAKKVGVKAERVATWEADEAHPTLNQLRKLAHVYHRPLSVFYLAERPTDFQVMHDFRRLPGTVAGRYSPALLFEIRSAQERRELALDLANEAGLQISPLALSGEINGGAERLANSIREYLSVSDDEQLGWHDPRVAFNAWRSMIEASGVLVFQTKGIGTSEMRGFSLAEDLLPVICVNNKDSPNGRVFSLLHELSHVALRRSSLCDFDEEQERGQEELRVEIFCNAVAAACLLPEGLFLGHRLVSAHAGDVWSDEVLWTLSKEHSVSREVVLRRLLTFGRTTRDYYLAKRQQYHDEHVARKDEESKRAKERKGRGPSPAVSTVSNFGKPYVRLVLENYYERRITLSDVSSYLGVRIKHLARIEQAVG
ncbi:MAG: ImmA/IrrE family metallo-endopeptidase [Alphaproteobacteria bacterium]|nr:ImmA/IrrE family metallo-endopeptidase [Alphaproteobacteria bacterium]